MDHIKEEVEEFKLEKMESIDVDENNDDIKLSLHNQNIKLEIEEQVMNHADHSINLSLKEESKLTFGLLEEKPSYSTVYFES
ncbi:hypothetical protein C0J52_25030, partial [Blattella germanica]